MILVEVHTQHPRTDTEIRRIGGLGREGAEEDSDPLVDKWTEDVVSTGTVQLLKKETYPEMRGQLTRCFLTTVTGFCILAILFRKRRSPIARKDDTFSSSVSLPVANWWYGLRGGGRYNKDTRRMENRYQGTGICLLIDLLPFHRFDCLEFFIRAKSIKRMFEVADEGAFPSLRSLQERRLEFNKRRDSQYILPQFLFEFRLNEFLLAEGRVSTFSSLCSMAVRLISQISQFDI